MSAIAKPQLRGYHVASLKKQLIATFAIGGLFVVTYKHFVMDARKKRYAEFYKTYNPEKRLKIMNDAGLMQSCPKP